MTAEQLAALLSLGSLLKDLGAIGGLLVLIWLVLEGKLVTSGHHAELMAAKDEQIDDARAEKAEWKRVATRGSEEIIAPLASAVREQLGTQRERSS